MENEKLRPYLKDECCVHLIQCFLNPDLMIEDKENISIEQQTPEHSVDSIYGLFTPRNPCSEDKSKYACVLCSCVRRELSIYLAS